jgi:hypothetical protein
MAAPVRRTTSTVLAMAALTALAALATVAALMALIVDACWRCLGGVLAV